MSSRTIFFSVVIAKIARHSRVAHCFKGFLRTGRVRYPFPLAVGSLALSFLLDATCLTVFGSRVTKDAEIQKSRRARDQKSETRDPFRGVA